MGRTIEIEGKTIDEAIFLGLEQLKLSFDEVEIFILEEGSKGFLGIGNKSAKVRLEERDEALVIPREQPKPVQRQPQQRPQPRSDSRPADRRSSGQGASRPAARSQSGAPRDNRRREPIQEDFSNQPYFPADAVFVENDATGFLQGLIEKMGIQGSIKAVETENGLLINMEGDNMGALIGYRGETLDALQYLTSLIYNKDKEEYHRVTLDTENYRKKREQTLTRLAKRLATKAHHSGSKVALEPMNPFERRVIHFALQNDRYVTTYSEGEEPNRRIIIAPKNGK